MVGDPDGNNCSQLYYLLSGNTNQGRDNVAGSMVGGDWYHFNGLTRNLEVDISKYYKNGERYNVLGEKEKYSTFTDGTNAHTVDVYHPELIEEARINSGLERLKSMIEE